MQAHADRSLKDVGAKRAAVDVEFDAQIAGITDPGDLIAGIEDYYFGKNTNENWAFSHAESLQLSVESWKFCGRVMVGKFRGMKDRPRAVRAYIVNDADEEQLEKPVPKYA